MIRKRTSRLFGLNMPPKNRSQMQNSRNSSAPTSPLKSPSRTLHMSNADLWAVEEHAHDRPYSMIDPLIMVPDELEEDGEVGEPLLPDACVTRSFENHEPAEYGFPHATPQWSTVPSEYISEVEEASASDVDDEDDDEFEYDSFDEDDVDSVYYGGRVAICMAVFKVGHAKVVDLSPSPSPREMQRPRFSSRTSSVSDSSETSGSKRSHFSHKSSVSSVSDVTRSSGGRQSPSSPSSVYEAKHSSKPAIPPRGDSLAFKNASYTRDTRRGRASDADMAFHISGESSDSSRSSYERPATFDQPHKDFVWNFPAPDRARRRSGTDNLRASLPSERLAH